MQDGLHAQRENGIVPHAYQQMCEQRKPRQRGIISTEKWVT